MKTKMMSLLLVSCSLVLTGCPGVGSLLRAYNFTEVRPASTLLAPGTVVWVKHARPFNAGIICTQTASLGGAFKALESPTATIEMRRALSTEFQIDAQYLKEIQLDARLKHVSNVTVQLRNPTVYAVTDTDVLASVGQRNPLCTQAIEARQEAGYTVSMISAALLADVNYKVSYSQEVQFDPKVKLEIAQQLALKLGVAVNITSESTIEAKGLYWGIVDDRHLAMLGTNKQDEGDEGNNQRRFLSAESVPMFDFSPDVDVDDR